MLDEDHRGEGVPAGQRDRHEDVVAVAERMGHLDRLAARRPPSTPPRATPGARGPGRRSRATPAAAARRHATAPPRPRAARWSPSAARRRATRGAARAWAGRDRGGTGRRTGGSTTSSNVLASSSSSSGSSASSASAIRSIRSGSWRRCGLRRVEARFLGRVAARDRLFRFDMRAHGSPTVWDSWTSSSSGVTSPSSTSTPSSTPRTRRCSAGAGSTARSTAGRAGDPRGVQAGSGRIALPRRPADRPGGRDDGGPLPARWVIHTVGPVWSEARRPLGTAGVVLPGVAAGGRRARRRERGLPRRVGGGLRLADGRRGAHRRRDGAGSRHERSRWSGSCCSATTPTARSQPYDG